jgi:branched-chain amino acid transport system substrate-binding protein
VDFVYFGGYHPEMGLLLRQAREQGVKATFMGPEGVGNKDVTAIAGPASEGMLVTLPADFSADPANAGLVKAFADKKRDANGPFQMPAYAAVKIIADASRARRAPTRRRWPRTCTRTTFDTPIGKVAYDAQGDLKSFKFVVYTWHKDAKDRRQVIPAAHAFRPRAAGAGRRRCAAGGLHSRAAHARRDHASRMNDFFPSSPSSWSTA